MTATPLPADSRAGLFGPESVTWRLHSDPLLWVAGLRALYLQALHPVALHGVTSFSSFRDDPWGRLIRTGEWVGITTFAEANDARRLAARVRGLHRKVRGTHEGTGRSYRADDPDLLLWIHICLVDSVLDIVRRAGIALTDVEADTYVAEQVRIAELVGLSPELVPATVAELKLTVDSYRPVLQVDAETRDVARFVLAPPMPLTVQLATPARPAWTTISAMALTSLPVWARELYGLPTLPLAEPLTGLGLGVSLRALRLATLALPAPLREGPHLRAAKARLAEEPAA